MKIACSWFCRYFVLITLLLVNDSSLFAQTDEHDKISIRSQLAGGSVYFLDCVDGFGGGNVAASIGKDGILLVDDMYDWMVPKLKAHLKTISSDPIRIVANTHFHRDHIEGNKSFAKTSIIIANENVWKLLIKNKRIEEPQPVVTFTDRLVINFNDEEIQLIHFPKSHTDSDAIVYFTKSKVLHLGDMFFFGMFPGIYKEGGGDVKGLISSLDQIVTSFPSDVKVIPGHGELASMNDLHSYITMLKETVAVVEEGIKKGSSLEQIQIDNRLAKYAGLGNGGAQTTVQYIGMLYKLLQ